MPTQNFLMLFSVADFDAEERVDYSLDEILKLLDKSSKQKFGQEADVWSSSRGLSLVMIVKLSFDKLVI